MDCGRRSLNQNYANMGLVVSNWKYALILLVLIAANVRGASLDACQTLAVCTQQLREIAQTKDKFRGMGPDATRMKQQILAFPGAVDALIPLLEDPDERIAELASYVLRDAPAIDPAYLPRLRAGLDRGLSWLAPALARIGTDEAAKEAVDRYLVSDDAPQNQEAHAVKIFGRRAIPFIVERARCLVPCKDDAHYLLGAALAGMGSARAEAAPALMTIASDRTASPQVAKGALLMISKLGTDGRSLEADLLRERDAAPYLSPWIDQALVGIHSRAAAAIFLARLNEEPSAITLRDLAEVGDAGSDAGPAVVAILLERSGLKVEAAKTLGYIGYAPAVPALVAALDDPVDARLPATAATALGRLQAKDALAALDRTAEEHWYPPAREAARKAAISIRSGTGEPARRSEGNFAMEFFGDAELDNDLPNCSKYREKLLEEPAGTKLYARTSGRQLKRLKYRSEVVSYGASDEAEQKASGADVIRVHPENLMEHRKAIEQVPDVALRVDGGWLAGSSRGEWGGELVFISSDGQTQRILDKNVEDIYRLGTRVVVVVGLAHMAMNNGELLEVKEGSDGRWSAVTWRVLPGAPSASFLVAPQALAVETIGRGSIIIDAEGGMRMANCIQ